MKDTCCLLEEGRSKRRLRRRGSKSLCMSVLELCAVRYKCEDRIVFVETGLQLRVETLCAWAVGGM